MYTFYNIPMVSTDDKIDRVTYENDIIALYNFNIFMSYINRYPTVHIYMMTDEMMPLDESLVSEFGLIIDNENYPLIYLNKYQFEIGCDYANI